MSSCDKYQELISRMVDGDLSADEKHELADHIENCPSCSALFQAFFSISKVMEDSLEEPPVNLRDSVMAEIQRAEIRRRNRIPTILRGVLSAAACVAVIVGVYLGVSLTQGKNLITAAFDRGAGSASEEKAAVMEAAEAPLEATLQERAAAAARDRDTESNADTPILKANDSLLMTQPAAAQAPAEEPAPEEDAAESVPAGGAPEAEAAAEPEAAQDEAGEQEIREWTLSSWDLSLLRALLGGSRVDVSQEAMEPFLMGRILVENRRESWTVPVYEKDGVLYYQDPDEESFFQAELTPQELLDFLRG